jgi:hypothetical protein
VRRASRRAVRRAASDLLTPPKSSGPFGGSIWGAEGRNWPRHSSHSTIPEKTLLSRPRERLFRWPATRQRLGKRRFEKVKFDDNRIPSRNLPRFPEEHRLGPTSDATTLGAITQAATPRLAPSTAGTALSTCSRTSAPSTAGTALSTCSQTRAWKSLSAVPATSPRLAPNTAGTALSASASSAATSAASRGSRGSRQSRVGDFREEAFHQP